MTLVQRAKKRSVASPPPKVQEILITSDSDRWRLALGRFASLNVNAPEFLTNDEALYVLPAKIIDHLCRDRVTHRRKRPILTDYQQQIERNFTALCLEFSPYTIGVYRGRPIQCPFLDDFNYGEIGDCFEKRPLTPWKADEQQLTYAGALAFHKPYQLELKSLKHSWLKLSRPELWPFGSLKDAEKSGETQPVLEYFKDYEAFCSSWQLADLCSWEVPWPQGCLEQVTVQQLSLLVGPETLVDYYPPYLDTPCRSIGDKYRMREALVQKPAITRGFEMRPLAVWNRRLPPVEKRQGRGPGGSEFNTAFQMWLFELAVERRYGKLRGLASVMDGAVADLLDRNEDRMKHVRYGYRRQLEDAPPSRRLASNGNRNTSGANQAVLALAAHVFKKGDKLMRRMVAIVPQ